MNKFLIIKQNILMSKLECNKLKMKIKKAILLNFSLILILSQFKTE